MRFLSTRKIIFAILSLGAMLGWFSWHRLNQPTAINQFTSPEVGQTAPEPKAEPLGQARASEVYGKLPLRFEANQGQENDNVKFKARGAGYNLWLTSDEAVLQLRLADCGLKKAAND